MKEYTTIKITASTKKLLAYYKLENDLGTFSEAVIHLIERVTTDSKPK